MKVTVNSLLNQPYLENAKVYSGEKYLTNVVESITFLRIWKTTLYFSKIL